MRCTPLEYLRVDGRLYILTEGGLKFKGIWWNGAISAAVFDSYAGMASLELLDGALRADGYAARQVLDLG